MKTMRMLAAVFIMGATLVSAGRAQEKAKPTEDSKRVTPLKVQVVLSEFDGEKKVSSLPYTFSLNADEGHPGIPTSLRMGLRVPVAIGTKDSPNSIQYMDVGTDVDCSAQAMDGGRFRLDLTVRRSSIYSAGTEQRTPGENTGEFLPSARPIVRQFSTSLHLLVRDGQTLQSTTATDPVSGHVLKIDVTASAAR